jgi:hypothetical protein
MSIFYFEMQGLKEKQKKSEKLGLFVVCMHTAKDHLVTLPCAYTRQRPHVAVTCALHNRLGVYASGFVVRASSRAHGNEQCHSPRQSMAHGNAIAHGKARRTAKDTERTAASGCTGKNLTHGNVLSHGKGSRAHDNDFLPRQRLCRLFLA